MAHHQGEPGLLRQLHQLGCVRCGQRQRLLDEHVLVGAQRRFGLLVVKLRGRCDDERVDVVASEDLVGVGVGCVARRQAFAHRGVGIANGDDSRVVQLPEDAQQLAPPVADAQLRDADGCGHGPPLVCNRSRARCTNDCTSARV